MLFYKKTKHVGGKPETPQVGLGDSNPYTHVIYISSNTIYVNKYEWIYPIGNTKTVLLPLLLSLLGLDSYIL